MANKELHDRLILLLVSSVQDDIVDMPNATRIQTMAFTDLPDDSHPDRFGLHMIKRGQVDSSTYVLFQKEVNATMTDTLRGVVPTLTAGLNNQRIAGLWPVGNPHPDVATLQDWVEILRMP